MPGVVGDDLLNYIQRECQHLVFQSVSARLFIDNYLFIRR